MRILTSLSILAALAGCSDAPPRLAPVAGAVRLDGRPLPQGVIIFEAEDAPRASGRIVNGEILDVTTHEPNDGLTPGPKMVAVRPSAGPAAQAARGGTPPIPQRYFDPATSGLTCEIVDGPNKLVFSLISESSGPPRAQ